MILSRPHVQISFALSNEREITQLIPLLNNRINQLEQLKSFTDIKRRQQFSNAYIIGRLTYMMPTYTNLNINQKDELHKILMRTARMTLNSYCFKQSIESILEKCNWLTINDMIKQCALKFTNNLLLKHKPSFLYSNLKINKRACSNISFVSFLRSNGLKSTLLYKGSSLYNQLPKQLKHLKAKTFKENISQRCIY